MLSPECEHSCSQTYVTYFSAQYVEWTYNTESYTEELSFIINI